MHMSNLCTTCVSNGRVRSFGATLSFHLQAEWPRVDQSTSFSLWVLLPKNLGGCTKATVAVRILFLVSFKGSSYTVLPNRGRG